MATRKKKETKTIDMPGTIGSAKLVFPGEPKIIRGSHSTRTEYPDGRVEFVTHWDELVRDVRAAILEYESNISVTEESKTKQNKGNENGKTRKTRKSK